MLVAVGEQRVWNDALHWTRAGGREGGGRSEKLVVKE